MTCIYRGRSVSHRPEFSIQLCLAGKGRCVDTIAQRDEIAPSRIVACEGCERRIDHGPEVITIKYDRSTFVKLDSPDVSRKPKEQSVRVTSKEPVGTKLKEILQECGISQPTGCSCNVWISQMNNWGIDGCRAHRVEILSRLDDASKETSWLSMLKVAARGYLTTGALLDEAINRVSSV